MGPRYSIIPGDALSDPRVKDGHLRVLAVLGTHTDRNGWCRVNQKTIAQKVGKSRETVNRLIKSLCAMGYVQKRDQWSKSEGRSISKYQILMDRDEVAQDVDTPCDADVTAPVTSRDHNPCDIQTSQHNDPSFNDQVREEIFDLSKFIPGSRTPETLDAFQNAAATRLTGALQDAGLMDRWVMHASEADEAACVKAERFNRGTGIMEARKRLATAQCGTEHRSG